MTALVSAPYAAGPVCQRESSGGRVLIVVSVPAINARLNSVVIVTSVKRNFAVAKVPLIYGAFHTAKIGRNSQTKECHKMRKI